MKNYREKRGMFYRVLFFSVFIYQVTRAVDSVRQKIVFGLLIVAIFCITSVRKRILKEPQKKSLLAELLIYLSLMIAGVIGIATHAMVAQIYYYVVLVEIVRLFVFQQRWRALWIEFILYLGFFSVDSFVAVHSWNTFFDTLFYPIILPFWSVFIISYLNLKVRNNRQTVESLNEELLEKVEELQAYSDRVKELTLIEERQRISQSLHDMLGHSLIGLKLHLDAANQLVEENPKQVHQILEKSNFIIEESLVELRGTVNELNEVRELVDLQNALENLRQSISVSNQVELRYDFSFPVNSLDIELKELIYKTCQEAITNSIKHGKSSQVWIQIKKNADLLSVVISNNGLGVTAIKPSYGLEGIQTRVAKFAGEVHFGSPNGRGFVIDITIPLEVKSND